MTNTPMRIDPDGVDRPQLATIVSSDFEGVRIRELGTVESEGKWIQSATPREAHR